jgi:hypothetical protein
MERTSIHLPELENLAIESGGRYELLKILDVKFVEQLLIPLWDKPENLVVPGNNRGLMDLITISVILHVNKQPTSGRKLRFAL